MYWKKKKKKEKNKFLSNNKIFLIKFLILKFSFKINFKKKIEKTSTQKSKTLKIENRSDERI